MAQIPWDWGPYEKRTSGRRHARRDDPWGRRGSTAVSTAGGLRRTRPALAHTQGSGLQDPGDSGCLVYETHVWDCVVVTSTGTDSHTGLEPQLPMLVPQRRPGELLCPAHGALTAPGHQALASWASQRDPLGDIPGPSRQSRAPHPDIHTQSVKSH